jgi:hypothetical protein
MKESILLLVRITVCMGTNRNLFRRTVFQKRRKVNNYPLDNGSWVEYSNIPQSQTKIVQLLEVVGIQAQKIRPAPNCSPLAEFFNK